ncbi:MAG TPA: carbohydrate binding domain-containing protein [Kineosporiaceae bacterium]|nr:carbohydrate binding domain-containing protein [Kineosporiaceae bacterium]
MVGALAGLAAVLGPTHLKSAPVAEDRELVVNGGFEKGLTGWRVNDPAAQRLDGIARGHSGAAGASVVARRSGPVALNDATNTVAKTTAGTSYSISAWVRSAAPFVVAQLRVREVTSGKLVSTDGQAIRLESKWQKVSMTYLTHKAKSSIDLNVIGWNVPSGQALQVDDISMRKITVAPLPVPPTAIVTKAPTTKPTKPAPSSTAPAASSKPTPTAPSRTTDPAPPPVPPGAAVGTASVIYRGQTISNCLSARGIPSCGAFMGAAIGGNADPTRREAQFGGTMGLRRTYYQAGQVANAVRTAKADLAANRLPWISFKEPYSWTEMANGKGDAWAKDLALQLRGVGGPVWLAIHHEPENDGNMPEWVRMQAHLAPIIRANAPNVAFSIVLTGYNQVMANKPALSFEALWPGDGLIDIIGIDPYNNYGVVKNGKAITKFTELKEYYAKLAPFAAAHHTHWAVGETGYTQAAAAKDPAWLTRSFNDLVSMGGIGYAYFDSTLNSVGTWTLDSSAKISAFSQAMKNSVRLP